MFKKFFQGLLPSVLFVLILSGCVTRRTVTKNGRVIEKKNVIKRPVKNFIENTEFE